MLDIGFSELLLTMVVALVVIGPKDMPVVVRHVVRAMRGMRRFYEGARGQATQLLKEAGVEDISREMTTIIDLEGKPQQAYDVRELEELSSRHKPGSQAQTPTFEQVARDPGLRRDDGVA